MNKEITKNSNSDIEMEACAWIAQLETGDLTAEDLAAYREWMSRSPVHRDEIRKLAYLSNEINILAEIAPSLKNAIEGHNRVTKKHSIHPVKVFSYVSMGVMLVVGLISWQGYFASHQIEQVAPVVISTNIGNHRDVKLSDGSIVNLNTNSKIEIDYNNHRRKVRLLKGEAFFQVVHYPDRPFIVYAGEKSIRAVGTAFIVKLQPKSFEVTVTEGRIELTQTATINMDVIEVGRLQKQKPDLNIEKKLKPIMLSAGETVVYKNSQKEIIGDISQTEIERKLAWQEGIIDFSNMALVDVVEDLSRYTSLKIEIADPELRGLKFGGVFRMDEIESLFDALDSGYNIKVEYGENGVVRLKRHTVTRLESKIQ